MASKELGEAAMTYSQRVALGGLKLLGWSLIAFAVVMLILWSPVILMWLLRY